MPRQIDMQTVLRTLGIPFDENARGWLTMDCPFCDAQAGTHGRLGWSGAVFFCWRCGTLRTVEALVGLTGQQERDIQAVLREARSDYAPHKQHNKEQCCKGKLQMPYGAMKMTAAHKRYLRERGFNPEELSRDWGLLGTGGTSDVPHRIIIPVTLDGQVVAWQARALNDKHAAKYLSCPDEKARVPIKHCLYGVDKVPGKRVVVTEGPTKVWRLGPGAVATLGAGVTTAQMTMLCRFHEILILFDDDPAGRDGARKLAANTSVLGLQTTIVEVPGLTDAADLSPQEARKLMKDLLK
jgi:hypothetical protein